ncbi:MAG TPA: hypothetical protein VGB42_02280 [Candidatus Thermoplasmatota archaeon]
MSHLSPEEAFKRVKDAFKRMADETAVSFKNAGWTPSGDVMVEFGAKREKAFFKARFGARVSPEGKLRAFSDLGLKDVVEAQGPTDAELSRCDAEDATVATARSIDGLLDDVQSVFPRKAVYQAKSKQWEIRVAVVRVGEKDLTHFGARVNMAGQVTSLKKRKTAIL